MPRKLSLSIIASILIISSANIVVAYLPVGVKEGDWIEYSVSYIGSPIEGHNTEWARMEVLEVNQTEITIMIISRLSDGSTERFNATLNLETGHLIDSFIIPANLSVGDSFYDENLGNVTIVKEGQGSYAGAVRTVLFASTSENTYVWDQVTGVSVEGTAETADFSMHTIVQDTNMWELVEEQNLSVLFAVFLVMIIAVSTLIAGVSWHRKHKHS